MRQSRSVKFETSKKAGKRFELVDNEIVIYDRMRTQIEDIIPLLVKQKRAKKFLKSIDLVISWKAIAEALQTRSVDDIRNYWSLKVLPLFDDQALI